MYLKKTELEQALRENMQSTLESYGGDSIAEDAICFCYDSMLAVIKQLAKDKREIMSEEELVLLLCIVQDDTRHQHQDLEMCKLHGLDAAETVKSRNDPKKVSVPVCCICQNVINGDAEWIRTKRGTVLYMHRECVRKLSKARRLRG